MKLSRPLRAIGLITGELTGSFKTESTIRRCCLGESDLKMGRRYASFSTILATMFLVLSGVCKVKLRSDWCRVAFFFTGVGFLIEPLPSCCFLWVEFLGCLLSFETTIFSSQTHTGVYCWVFCSVMADKSLENWRVTLGVVTSESTGVWLYSRLEILGSFRGSNTTC